MADKERSLSDLMVYCTPIEDLGDGKFKCLAQMGFEGEKCTKGVEITLDLSGRNKKIPPT